MTPKEDNISRKVLYYVDVLMLKNPERTVLGFLLGLVLSFLSQLLKPALLKIEAISLTNIQPWEYIPVGVIIVHLPYILWSMFRKPFFNDEVDEVIRLVEHSNFSDKEKRNIYRNLVNKCTENLFLELPKKQFLNDAKKQFITDL